MRPSTFATFLALAASAFATPIATRDECSSDPIVFRFLFGAYCLVGSGLPHNGPCPVLKEMQNTNLSLANPVVEMDVIGHNITLTFIPTYSSVFGSANVTIDGVLRTATGQDFPNDLFGAGITRSYDYPLESTC